MDEDEIDRVLADFELAEYICFLLEYVEAALEGYANPDDAKYCFKEYAPRHPVMLAALDLYAHH
jgi:hypothetical protein